jgi:hypothetical protein
MKDLNHAKHRYLGNPGEAVTVEVIAHDTTHMVQFSLDGGPAQVLPEGEAIRFNLKNSSGELTTLQITMDFNHMGAYDLVVSNVSDCSVTPPPRCVHTRSGPDQIIENHKYGVE